MLTEDMGRLRDEIITMRKVRGSLLSDLQKVTKSRKKVVAQLCSHFGHIRSRMAKQTKHERLAFLDSLKHAVVILRKETADDLVGARNAWVGKS
jgi:hypothetical protein